MPSSAFKKCARSEEHTSELQSHDNLVCRLLLEKKSSAVEHRPADVVPLALVVEDELPDRLRELVTLPLTLAWPCGLALAFRRGSACGLDRIGGRTELVCGDMRNDPRLAGSVGGMPRSSPRVSGRPHCRAARRARLGHRDLAPHSGAGMLDRLARPRVLG